MLKLILLIFIPFYFLAKPLILYAAPITAVSGNIDGVYVAATYTDNQHVQFISVGFYPNTCFHVADAEIKIDRSAKNIFVTPQAYYYGGYCLDMIIGYQQTLELGLLAAGEYKIYEANQKRFLGTLHVEHF